MNEEILKRLDVIAAKMGIAATQLWAALIRQARVEAITDTVWCVLLLGIILFLVRFVVTLFNDGKNEHEYDGTLAVTFSVVAFVLFITLMVIASNIPTEWLNPDYFALERLLSKLK